MKKTREEIEHDLLAAVQLTRSQYERARAEQAAATALRSDLDCANPDGRLAIHQEWHATAAMRRALQEYREALQQFTDFVVAGKLPGEE